jgi:hypothetical protein
MRIAKFSQIMGKFGGMTYKNWTLSGKTLQRPARMKLGDNLKLRM